MEHHCVWLERLKKSVCNRPLFMGDLHLGHFCYITVCSIYCNCSDTTRNKGK